MSADPDYRAAVSYVVQTYEVHRAPVFRALHRALHRAPVFRAHCKDCGWRLGPLSATVIAAAVDLHLDAHIAADIRAANGGTT